MTRGFTGRFETVAQRASFNEISHSVLWTYVVFPHFCFCCCVRQAAHTPIKVIRFIAAVATYFEMPVTETLLRSPSLMDLRPPPTHKNLPQFLLINIVLPVVIYYLVVPSTTDMVAVLLSALPPAGESLYQFRAYHCLDPISALVFTITIWRHRLNISQDVSYILSYGRQWWHHASSYITSRFHSFLS